MPQRKDGTVFSWDLYALPLSTVSILGIWLNACYTFRRQRTQRSACDRNIAGGEILCSTSPWRGFSKTLVGFLYCLYNTEP